MEKRKIRNKQYNLCLYHGVFKLDWVIMSIVILCVIAMGLYGLIGAAERWYRKRV